MSRDTWGKGLVGVVIAVAVCCGAAALLVSAGVLAVGGGLLSSPELTVAAVLLAVAGMWRLVTTVSRRLKDDR